MTRVPGWPRPYVYATARDFARFGLLNLRDGMWEDRRLLPEGWVDHGRRPRSVDPDDSDYYGSHWWTRDNLHGTFWAAGHEGQFIDICPDLDLVLVRLGRTEAEHSEELKRWRTRVIEAFAPIAADVPPGSSPAPDPTAATSDVDVRSARIAEVLHPRIRSSCGRLPTWPG